MNEGFRMMQFFEKKMIFWGNRHYVQGTHQMYAAIDVFRELGFGEIMSISARFRKQLHGNCRFVLGGVHEESMEGWHTKVLFRTNSGDYNLFVFPSGSNDCERIEDDEVVLVDGFVLNSDAKRIEKAGYDSERVLTVLTSLNKILLDHLLSKRGFGRWVLVDFYCQWPLNGKNIALKLEQNIGNRMTGSIIYVDSKAVGNIKFSREVRA